MQLNSLTDVLYHELKDLYSAEKQLVEALPKMTEAAQAAELKRAFEEHLRLTEEHRERLERVGQQLGVDLSGETCEAMKGLIKESEKLIREAQPSDARDAALIAAAQRVEHYEMAAYGAARTYARTLGHADVASTLQKTLDEEGDADKVLTKLAEARINQEAASG